MKKGKNNKEQSLSIGCDRSHALVLIAFSKFFSDLSRKRFSANFWISEEGKPVNKLFPDATIYFGYSAITLEDLDVYEKRDEEKKHYGFDGTPNRVNT